MACLKCCCSTRCVQYALSILSTLFLILSGLSIYLSIRTKSYNIWGNNQDPAQQDYVEETSTKGQDIKHGLFYGSLVVSIVSVLLSILGMYTAGRAGGCKKILLFTIFSFLMTLVLFGLGLGFLMINLVSKNYISNTCNDTPLSNVETKARDYQLGYLQLVDQYSYQYIEKYMCKADCPCVKVDSTKWGNSLNNPAKGYRFNGTITNFDQCYSKLVAEKKIKPITENTRDFMSYLEYDGDCIGVCDRPQFWYFKDVTSGPPGQDCEKFIKKNISKSVGYLSAVTLVAAVVIFMSFCTQFGLWGKRNRSIRRVNKQISDNKTTRTQSSEISF